MTSNEDTHSNTKTARFDSESLLTPGVAEKETSLATMNGPPGQCDTDIRSTSAKRNSNIHERRNDNIHSFANRSESRLHATNAARQAMDTINQFRMNCGKFINNDYVQFFIVALIAVNAIMMGIGTYDFVRNDDHLSNIFETIDLTFLIIFTVELCVQFIFHGLRLLLDGWLVFDLVIIVTSWSFSSTQIIRAFRIFRALRLVTRIKVMKNLILGSYKSTRSVLSFLSFLDSLPFSYTIIPVALFGVVPRMSAIGLMLALIFYIFAVMFTQLFDDLEDTEYNYFGGMGFTLFTLFQMMTLDNWASICREAMLTYSWAWVPFIAFVIISGFIIVNLIIAVICDAISSLHESDKAKLQGKYTEDGDSHVSAPLEIREQLDCLEEQMIELTKTQARTFHTLQYLTRQMQMHKLQKELASKSTIAEAARNLKKLQREISQKAVGMSNTVGNARAVSLRDDTNRDTNKQQSNIDSSHAQKI